MTVKEIAKSMAPQNGSGEAATAKLSRGNIATNADVNPAANVAKPNISKASIGEIVSVLNTLSPSIIAISKLSGRQIKNFTDVLDHIIKSVNKLSECAKRNKDEIRSTNIITESLVLLSNSIKGAAGLVVNAPLAMLGLKFANGVISGINSILTAVSDISDISQKIKKLNSLTAAIDPLINVITKATIFAGLCMGLGLLLMVGHTKDIILGGLIVLGSVILSTTAVILLTAFADKLINGTGALGAMKNIMTVMLASVALVAACFGIGMAIEAMGGWEPLMKGLGIVALTMITLTGIFALVGWAGKLAMSDQVIKSYAAIYALSFASFALVVTAKFVGDYAIENYGSILTGLGSVVSVIGLFIGIGWIASKALQTSKQAVISLAAIEGLAIGAMAIIVLSKQLSDYTRGHEIEILEAIGLSSSIIGAFGTLAFIAGKLQSSIAVGIPAVALVEALAAGAIAVAGLTVALDYVKTQNGITWGDLYLDVAGVMGIITAFGLLAAAASLVAPEILFGTVALAPVELLIAGAVGVTHLVLNLHKTISESGTGWKEIELDVLGMSAMLGTFGLFASAMSLLVVPIALGTPGIIAVSGFSLLMINVVGKIVDLSKAIDAAGGSDKIKNTLSVGIPAILKNINKENFNVDLGIATMLKMTAKYALISELVGSILTVAESISKISQIAGIVDDNGNLRQIVSIDRETGKVRYGDPVNIKNLATVISKTVKEFVENSQYSFAEVLSMYNAKEIFEILSTITEPISKFVEMLTGFTAGKDPDTLCSVSIAADGTVKTGAPVNIKNVAGIIADAITAFVSKLYDKNVTENWAEIIYGDRTFFESLFGKTNKKADSVREVTGVLGVIIDPICKFVDMVSVLAPGDGNTLRKIYIDKDGKPKADGPGVDINRVGTLISGLITSFVTAIYSNDALKGIDVNGAMPLEQILKPINAVVKTAGDLSNLNGERILTNSKAIVTFMSDIVGNAMPKSKKTVDDFSTSLENLKTAFKDLDTILTKDEDKRLKALDSFEKRIRAIVDDVNDGKNAIEALNNLIKTAQEYEAPESARVVSQNGTIMQQNANQVSLFDYDLFADRLVSAIKEIGLKIKPSADDGPIDGTSVRLINGFTIG